MFSIVKLCCCVTGLFISNLSNSGATVS